MAGDKSLAVCDKKAQAWRLTLKKKTVKEVAEIMGISTRSVYRYIKSAKDKAVLDFEEMQARDAGAEAKEMYDLIKRETFEMIREAEKQHDDGNLKYKDFAYIWNTLMDKVRLTQMSEDTLMGKTGVFEGDKATINVFVGLKPQEQAEEFKRFIDANPEDAQVMLDYLYHVKRLRPAVEGELVEIDK